MKILDKVSANFHLVEWITILGAVISCFLFLLGRVERIEAKVEGYRVLQEETNRMQAARTDRLYEMFIDLLKDQRKSEK